MPGRNLLGACCCYCAAPFISYATVAASKSKFGFRGYFGQQPNNNHFYLTATLTSNGTPGVYYDGSPAYFNTYFATQCSLTWSPFSGTCSGQQVGQYQRDSLAGTDYATGCYFLLGPPSCEDLLGGILVGPFTGTTTYSEMTETYTDASAAVGAFGEPCSSFRETVLSDIFEDSLLIGITQAALPAFPPSNQYDASGITGFYPPVNAFEGFNTLLAASYYFSTGVAGASYEPGYAGLVVDEDFNPYCNIQSCQFKFVHAIPPGQTYEISWVAEFIPMTQSGASVVYGTGTPFVKGHYSWDGSIPPNYSFNNKETWPSSPVYELDYPQSNGGIALQTITYNCGYQTYYAYGSAPTGTT